jgi:hypothetical protein
MEFGSTLLKIYKIEKNYLLTLGNYHYNIFDLENPYRRGCYVSDMGGPLFQ